MSKKRIILRRHPGQQDVDILDLRRIGVTFLPEREDAQQQNPRSGRLLAIDLMTAATPSATA